mgnify:CR=1 FL=1
MDLATLLGIIIGFVMVVIGIITSTTNPTLKGIMDTFVDIPSIAVRNCNEKIKVVYDTILYHYICGSDSDYFCLESGYGF